MRRAVPLGFFVPVVDPSIYEATEPELSDDELRHIALFAEWYSTADVLKHLEGSGDIAHRIVRVLNVRPLRRKQGP